MNFMCTIAKERLQRDYWEKQQNNTADTPADESEQKEEETTS
ncbi:small protein SR7P [Bacillus sp. YC2]|nr:hypothetical protein [Bacillus sp. YC2]